MSNYPHTCKLQLAWCKYTVSAWTCPCNILSLGSVVSQCIQLFGGWSLAQQAQINSFLEQAASVTSNDLSRECLLFITLSTSLYC